MDKHNSQEDFKNKAKGKSHNNIKTVQSELFASESCHSPSIDHTSVPSKQIYQDELSIQDISSEIEIMDKKQYEGLIKKTKSIIRELIELNSNYQIHGQNFNAVNTASGSRTISYSPEPETKVDTADYESTAPHPVHDSKLKENKNTSIPEDILRRSFGNTKLFSGLTGDLKEEEKLKTPERSNERTSQESVSYNGDRKEYTDHHSPSLLKSDQRHVSAKGT